MAPCPREHLITEEMQTMITFKNVGPSCRKIVKKVKVSQFPSLSKGTQKLGHTLTGRGLADPTPQMKQKTRQLRACVIGGSQDNNFKHSLIVVVVSETQFELWREDFELQVCQDELQ